MTNSGTFSVLAFLAACGMASAQSNLRGQERQLNGDCIVDECYLMDSYGKKEIKLLNEYDSYDPALYSGYSVRCSVSGTFHFVKFVYPDGGGFFDTFAPPYYMFFASEGWIEPVPYLKSEGAVKTFTVEIRTWEGLCGTKTYTLNTGGDAPIPSRPTRAPVDQPTKAPVMSPTKVPVMSPTKAPASLCPYGRKYVSGYCVKDRCHDDYKCPAFSYRIQYYGDDLRDCFNNFDDCECESGYVKNEHRETCEKPDPCEEGRKFVSGYCVKDRCHDDYLCPANSYRKKYSGKTLRDCFNNFEDCECMPGYYKNNKKQKCEKR